MNLLLKNISFPKVLPNHISISKKYNLIALYHDNKLLITKIDSNLIVSENINFNIKKIDWIEYFVLLFTKNHIYLYNIQIKVFKKYKLKFMSYAIRNDKLLLIDYFCACKVYKLENNELLFVKDILPGSALNYFKKIEALNMCKKQSENKIYKLKNVTKSIFLNNKIIKNNPILIFYDVLNKYSIYRKNSTTIIFKKRSITIFINLKFVRKINICAKNVILLKNFLIFNTKTTIFVCNLKSDQINKPLKTWKSYKIKNPFIQEIRNGIFVIQNSDLYILKPEIENNIEKNLNYNLDFSHNCDFYEANNENLNISIKDIKVNSIKNKKINSIEDKKVNSIEDKKINSIEDKKVNSIEDKRVNSIEDKKVNSIEDKKVNSIEDKKVNSIEDKRVNYYKSEINNNQINNNQINNNQINNNQIKDGNGYKFKERTKNFLKNIFKSSNHLYIDENPFESLTILSITKSYDEIFQICHEFKINGSKYFSNYIKNEIESADHDWSIIKKIRNIGRNNKNRNLFLYLKKKTTYFYELAIYAARFNRTFLSQSLILNEQNKYLVTKYLLKERDTHFIRYFLAKQDDITFLFIFFNQLKRMPIDSIIKILPEKLISEYLPFGLENYHHTSFLNSDDLFFHRLANNEVDHTLILKNKFNQKMAYFYKKFIPFKQELFLKYGVNVNTVDDAVIFLLRNGDYKRLSTLKFLSMMSKTKYEELKGIYTRK
ncbi:hypothetical protein DMUE_3715 [Dictyocoela muelleri]|nr:hypothetical protein DMUE_3715 [Dictyocoela muelleri]